MRPATRRQLMEHLEQVLEHLADAALELELEQDVAVAVSLDTHLGIATDCVQHVLEQVKPPRLRVLP